ncbi:urease accessory protein UreD [Sabulicella rubraurantiaca]|uniref:urease accessory protein UreD n=1 Tax=Sabulicella rubraurantiaca TaxID=2811429 RepID=UPI001A962387|nr:urease accessory protein UreD [Sabulicella rubraurantiaca]
MTTLPFRHQRADGGITARFTAGPGGARPVVLAQSAPLRLLLPDPEPDECSIAALLNTGGGLAGGDAVHVALALGPGGRLTLATAAAEKVYRSLGPATRIENRLEVEDGAALEWIPQETILFDGASLERRTEIVLSSTSRLLALEMLVFGRAAGGEVIRRLHLRDTWRLRRDGRLLWAEALRLDGPERLADPLGFGGAGAMATLLLAGPEAESLLPALRDALPERGHAGATRPAPGFVLARILGEAGAVRAVIAGILPMIRAGMLGQPRALPRLWTN